MHVCWYSMFICLGAINLMNYFLPSKSRSRKKGNTFDEMVTKNGCRSRLFFHSISLCCWCPLNVLICFCTFVIYTIYPTLCFCLIVWAIKRLQFYGWHLWRIGHLCIVSLPSISTIVCATSCNSTKLNLELGQRSMVQIFQTSNCINVNPILNCGQEYLFSWIFRKIFTSFVLWICLDLYSRSMNRKEKRSIYFQITLIQRKFFLLLGLVFYQFYEIISDLIYWAFRHIYGIVYNGPRPNTFIYWAIEFITTTHSTNKNTFYRNKWKKIRVGMGKWIYNIHWLAIRLYSTKMNIVFNESEFQYLTSLFLCAFIGILRIRA